MATLEELNAKMSNYVKMESELEFSEFVDYYNDLMGFLQAEYGNLDQDALIKCKGMCMIVAGNAKMRALRKDANRKKFTKMGEKAYFWEDAIARRLKKDGLSEQELDDRVSALWE